MIKDLTPLLKDLDLAFEANGISNPAFIVAFICKQTGYNNVHWASNISRTDSIKILEELITRMKAELG